MPKTSSKASIVNANENLVLKEVGINITDEKLSSLLKWIYERARKDANKFRLYSLTSTVWSVFFTLFLTLITTGVSGFTPPWRNAKTYTQDQMTHLLWVVDFVILAGGVILLWLRSKKADDQNRDRDSAVSDCIAAHCGQKIKPIKTI